MPANLPPQYLEVEKKLKTATTAEEKIAIYEELLSIIPKHKGTEKLQAMMKTKMAKLKSSSQKKGGTAKHGPSHKVRKSGAGQVVVMGLANTGKSHLINTLTNANLTVSNYAYSTHEPAPAMMKFENVQVQLVDTPPLSPDFMEPWYPDIIRAADAALITTDLVIPHPEPGEALKIIFDLLTPKRIEFYNRHGEKPEAKGHGWCCKKTLVAATKLDLFDPELLEIVREELGVDLELIPVSTETGEGLEELRTEIFRMLEVIRVYSKIPGKKAEFDDPFTLPVGSTVMDMAEAVHKDFAENLKFARIWGEHAYDGQRVNRQHVLEDEDIIELHM